MCLGNALRGNGFALLYPLQGRTNCGLYEVPALQGELGRGTRLGRLGCCCPRGTCPGRTGTVSKAEPVHRHSHPPDPAWKMSLECSLIDTVVQSEKSMLKGICTDPQQGFLFLRLPGRRVDARKPSNCHCTDQYSLN